MSDLPHVPVALPGPESRALVDVLARHESPGITARRARQGEARGTGSDPIVWARAEGASVWDVDGNRYVDLTGAFGVALVGHAHPAVVRAVQEQAATLMHGMGDVFPNAPRIRLMERLAALAPPGLTQCILGLSGSDAVEAALKTAALASGRPGVLAFWGSYHGLSYGALAATAYKAAFRAPFAGQLGPHVRHLPYGESLDLIERFVAGPATGGEAIGALLVEPILGRGGQVVPPDEWLRGLRTLADRYGLVLVFDEIYSGLGRTGRWWACDHAGVVPDVLCVGKALGGGMPVSAAIARPDVMSAWGRSAGEAIHTGTFLGHPVAAAAALATLDALVAMDAPVRAREFEAVVRARLGSRVRGRGAMLGVETGSPGAGARIAGRLLRDGYIVLPGGVDGDIIGLTPPLCLSEEQLAGALDALEAGLAAESP
ncbi:MAG: aminotransferase class III-fold pyridoxal phosphate-dependent enzyme [Deltaproteobacteria bacterium]|nr:aminotransferase class III-fold pyridoxal phosphate-dependent enzyme [Deltaproteobacteria bacterium]MCB9786273.1 aminotransferase class III-fold pyridoxal phosphate-dependent enzyme [Deltaproteobacteria bacterium]